jgi:chromosomal replication initiation ATPase DnaA
VKHTNSFELIKKLMKLVDAKGIEKAKKIIEQGLEEGYETQDLLIAFIIKSVCVSFNISESELFIGKSRKFGVRTKARAMLVFMLKNHLDLSQSQISQNLKLNKATVSRDFNYMENLNPKFSEEKKQLKKLSNLNNEIVNFVENNK